MARYQQLLVLSDKAWTDWKCPPRQFKFACCDCGSVHRIEARPSQVVSKRKNGVLRVKQVSNGRVVIRFRADKRATAQVRRHMPSRKKTRTYGPKSKESRRR